jgi:hypothetical protein
MTATKHASTLTHGEYKIALANKAWRTPPPAPPDPAIGKTRTETASGEIPRTTSGPASALKPAPAKQLNAMNLTDAQYVDAVRRKAWRR